MLQMASCSYDVHVQEILGALIVGATSVMLLPHGNMNLEYVMNVLNEKQITYMQTVPAYMSSMLEFFEGEDKHTTLGVLRTLDIGGKWIILKIGITPLCFYR